MCPRILDFTDGFENSEAPNLAVGFVTTQEVPTGVVNGINTDFELASTPASDVAILVLVDGVARNKSTEWNLFGNTVRFQPSHIPQVGQNVYCYYTIFASSPAATGTENVVYRTITSGEVIAKALTLAVTPANPANVRCTMIGGSAQQYLVDFLITGATVSWTGLGLDGLIAAGDVLLFVYVS